MTFYAFHAQPIQRFKWFGGRGYPPGTGYGWHAFEADYAYLDGAKFLLVFVPLN